MMSDQKSMQFSGCLECIDTMNQIINLDKYNKLTSYQTDIYLLFNFIFNMSGEYMSRKHDIRV